ncbi:MAG: hypothetical protein PHQ59_03470 [Candidatus Daviesbacteria bacterium]|nr:hypothetical protein [Candidatus Daviesbacteria bacterium]
MKKIYFFYSFILLIALILSLRGLQGNPNAYDLNQSSWKENGPFELSPERGRFTLLYSVIEDHSFYFSDQLGQFARPDVAVSKGRYVSLFAPLLSFITIPGYIIGKYFGIAQVGAFAIISLFAFFNFLLIRSISIRVGANRIAALLGATVFLFATPAFAYAVNLYQHHISTFLILMSIYLLLHSRSVWSLFLVFFLCALAIPLDYPNLFFLFPIGVYALGRTITTRYQGNNFKIRFNFVKFITISAMTLPILFFLWFNQVSYGNAFQLSGTLPSAKRAPLSKNVTSNTSLESQFAVPTPPVNAANNKSALGFFKTRQMLNGFYIQFISPDRGILYFSPVILLGVLGAFLAYKRKVKMVPLFVAIIGANILLYSMWGDPWGGWAFGSRYLIPSYAILSIFIALLLSYWQRKIWLLLIFIILFGFSVGVNTLGAITSSANPPKAEVLELEKVSGLVQKYTFERNWDFLRSNNSKSFVFQVAARKYMSAVQYYEILAGLIILSGLSLTTILLISGRVKRKNNK